MHSSRKKPGKPAKEQWAIVEPRTVPNWEAAHIFLEVARCGSFRAAAQKLAQSVNALRRKVDEFEHELNLPLLSTAHYAAIESGIGIGALPTYFQALGTGLVPLDLGIEQTHDIWLVFRADAKRVARVRKMLDWITRCYDPRKYPWFRDEFIHPDRFSALYKGAPPVRTAIFIPNAR